MSKNLETLEVSIEAKSNLKKGSQDAKKDAKDMVSSINKEMEKIKSPFSDLNEESDIASMKHMFERLGQMKDRFLSGAMQKDIGASAKNYVKEAQLAAGIRIPTGEYDDLEASIESTNAALDKLRQKEEKMAELGADQQSKSWQSLQFDIENVTVELDKLYAKEQRMETSGLADGKNEDWNILQKEITKAENALKRMQDRESRMQTTGADQESKSWQTLQYDIRKAEENLQSYQSKKKQMQSSGKDTEFAGQSMSSGSAIQSMVAMMRSARERTNEQMSQIRASIIRTIKSIPVIGRVATEAAYVASKAFKGMRTVITKVGPAIKKVGGFFGSLIQRFKSGIPILNRFGKSMNNTKSSAGGLGNGVFRLGNMFRMMLVRMAMKAAIDGAKEGFENLAKYSSSTNANLSTLMSSLTQLKNSFATAFAPILSVVTPILDTLLQKLISVVSAIGQFFSALTGKTAYVQAKKVTQDYAASLDKNTKKTNKANKANKDLQQTLMGFDKINKLDDPKTDSADTSAPGGLSPSDMFETVPIESKFKELAKKIKDIFSKIFDPIKKAWNKEGKATIAAFKYALNQIWGLVKSIGKSFLEVWTNGTGQLLIENILKLLQTVFRIIGDIAKAFKDAWNDNGLGTSVVQALFDMFNNIFTLLISIGEAFREAWNDNDLGRSIASNILVIFREIFNVIGNIASSLEKAWNKNGAGKMIFKAILKIINDILYRIKNMAGATADWGKKLDFSPLLTSIKNLLVAIQPLTDNIGAGLEWFYTNVLLPLAGFVIQDVIPVFLDILAGAIRVINEVVEALQPLGQWLFDNFLKPLAEWTGGLIVDILTGIADVLTRIGDWIKEHQEVVQTMAIIVGSFAAAWGLVNAVILIWNVICAIAAGVTTALATALAFLTSPVGLVVLAIGAAIAIGVLLYKNWDKIKEKAGQVWDWVKSKFNSFREFLSGLFQKDWTKTFGVMGEGLNVFCKFVTDIVASIKKIFSGIIKFIKGVFKGDWKQAWEGIKEIFSGIWDNLVATVKFPINGIIGFLNALIRGFSSAVNSIANMLNSIKIKIPDWVPMGLGGKSWSPNLPTWNPGTIPYLAKGGILSDPTLAMIGEGRHNEAVVPLEDNPEWVKYLNKQLLLKNDRESELVGRTDNRNAVSNNNQIVDGITSGVYQAVLAAMSMQGQQRNESPKIEVYVGGEKVTDVVVKEVNQRTKSTGICPILT